ncbi:MAG: hypothetical protein L0Y79_09785 [Chlorobi bacterium]|nr:hypothetical protein [Chlorobiota bacterium]MCI0716056.1 hypothetical protein [Chlorobiota bacterium]
MNKISIVTILLSTFHVLAQDTSITQYLPLQVGNIWVYQCSQNGQPPMCGVCSKKIRVNITSANIINGNRYFQSQVNTIHIFGSCPGCYSNLPNFSSNLRIDSLTGNVLEYLTNGGCPYRPNEKLHDSLKARLYDSIRYDCQPPQQWNAYVCRDTNNIIIFGQSRQARLYSIQLLEGGGGEEDM